MQRFALPPPSADEPIRFEVEVPHPERPGDTDIERFEVPRRIPAAAMIDLAILDVEAPGSSEWAAGVGRYLKLSMGSEWPRFARAISAAGWDLESLVGVMQFLGEEATARPTPPPADLPLPASPSGKKSTGGSSKRKGAGSGTAP